MKQLTIFDSIDQQAPGKRRQVSGRSSHLLVSKKKADEKFNIKRQITKKEEKERIVVNFTEQEKILCDILDEKK